MVAGLNANAEVESSGGEFTSKSFMGFTVAVDVLAANGDVPNPLGYIVYKSTQNMS